MTALPIALVTLRCCASNQNPVSRSAKIAVIAGFGFALGYGVEFVPVLILIYLPGWVVGIAQGHGNGSSSERSVVRFGLEVMGVASADAHVVVHRNRHTHCQGTAKEKVDHPDYIEIPVFEKEPAGSCSP
jgi:hypothetical protein